MRASYAREILKTTNACMESMRFAKKSEKTRSPVYFLKFRLLIKFLYLSISFSFR